MNDKLVDATAQMWATHPDAASLSLHWATIEQQLEAEHDRSACEFAKAVRNRAAEIMKSKDENSSASGNAARSA